jgi:hypothetical protein
MDPDEALPSSNDGKVLSPRELDLEQKDGVEEIDDGRYVVSPNGSQPSVPDTPDNAGTIDPAAPDQPGTANQPGTELTRETVRDWYRRKLQETPCDFGYHLSVKAGDRIDHHTLYSDDVTTVFNDLLLNYAQTVDSSMPPGAFLGLMLMETTIPVRYPPRSIEEFLLSHGLSSDDSITDLLTAVRDADEVVFPPGNG